MYNLQRAEDIFLRCRYLYYVKGQPFMSDKEFDMMQKYFEQVFSQSPVFKWIGSDNPDHYPQYIREGRRPLLNELRNRIPLRK